MKSIPAIESVSNSDVQDGLIKQSNWEKFSDKNILCPCVVENLNQTYL